MPKRRRLQEKPHWGPLTAAAIAKPPLLAFTRRDWSGGEHIPAQGGAVVAANHLSHVDPFTFAHFVWDHGRVPRFLAKAELFEVPIGGAILRHSGQIPVRRRSAEAAHAFEAAVEAVREGKIVAVYPEGTITRDPDLWPMTGRSGAARIALETGAPVIPVAQWGPQEILWPYQKRPHLLPRRTVQMRAGAPVDLDDLRGQQLTPQVLAEASTRIMDAITALLAELRGQQAPADRVDGRLATGLAAPPRQARDDDQGEQ